MKEYVEDASIEGRRREIEEKLERVYKALDDHGWDALYFGKAEGFAWITAGGNSVVSRFVELGVMAVLVTRTGRYAITSIIEKQRAIDEEKLELLGFELVVHPWYEVNKHEVVRKIVGDGAKVATDVLFPGTADANPAIAEMQYSLTDNEIARYAYLGTTFTRVLEETLAETRPGEMELEVVGRVFNALLKHNIDIVLYLVAGDERIYKYRHFTATQNRIRDYMMVSINARYKGLITKITRSVHFGEPKPELRKQYEDNLLIENTMMAATRIGEDNFKPIQAAIDLYEKLGYKDMWKLHHQGGAQGYTNGYYLITFERHEPVRLHQCYCFNPSITGTKTEDPFIVTEEGPLLLTPPATFPALRSVVEGIAFERPGMLVLEK